MAKIMKTRPEHMSMLMDVRNAIDNVIGEAKYWKRLAMSRAEVTICKKCSFFGDGICGCYGCPCYGMDIPHPDKFFCQMGVPKDEEEEK